MRTSINRLSPSEKLIEKLDSQLYAEFGLKIDRLYGIDTPRGGQRREDCCRWNAYAFDPTNLNIRHAMACWDTVTECVKASNRLVISFHGIGGGSEAPVMVGAAPLKKPRVYFAHAITDYNTEFERQALNVISQLYDGDYWDIVNPNSPEHDEAYKARGFDYFIELCDGCQAVVWAGFPDGRVGAGVAKEVARFEGRTLRITELDRDCTPWDGRLPQKVMTVDETRALIKELRAL